MNLDRKSYCRISVINEEPFHNLILISITDYREQLITLELSLSKAKEFCEKLREKLNSIQEKSDQ